MIRELLSVSAAVSGIGVLGIGAACISANDDLLRWSEMAMASGCLGVVVLFCVDAVMSV